MHPRLFHFDFLVETILNEKITKRKVKSCIVCLLGKELLWFTDTTKELLVSYKGDILH